MSGPKDPTDKPDVPRVPTAGRSGTASSIGAELGGDLDFEPDALLDSLLSEEEPKAPASLPGPKLHAPATRAFPADEVTQVTAGATDVARLIESAKAEIARSPAPAAPRSAIPRPGVPRPGGAPVVTAKPPAVNPPGPARKEPFPPAATPAPSEATPIPAAPVAAPPAPTAVAPGAVNPRDSLDEVPLLDDGFDDDFDNASLVDASFDEGVVEIAGDAGSDVDDLLDRPTPEPGSSAPAISDDFERTIATPEVHDAPPAAATPSPLPAATPVPVGVTPPPAAAPSPLAPIVRHSSPEIGASLEDLPESLDLDGVPDLDDFAADDAVEIAPDAPTSAPRLERSPSAGDIDDERPAADHLREQGALDEWRARAAWFEAEARASEDPGAKARGLLVASELLAMAGEARAKLLAQEAATTPGAPALASRQARGLAATAGEWKQVVIGLDVEARAMPTAEGKVHAAWYAAEIHRTRLVDDAARGRKLELAARASPGDPRAHLARVAAELAARTQRPRWPDHPDLVPIVAASDELARLDGLNVPGAGTASDLEHFELARRAVAARDLPAAAKELASLAGVADLAIAARWLSAAFAAQSSATRAAAIDALSAVVELTHSPQAVRALAARALEAGDGSAALRAIDQGDALSREDAAALAALSGSDPTRLVQLARALDGSADLSALAVAVAAYASLPHAEPPLSTSSAERRSELVLGRALSAAAGAVSSGAIGDLLAEFEAHHPGHALARALALDLAAEAGSLAAVGDYVGAWPGGGPDLDRDRRLAAALSYELASRSEAAVAEYRAVLAAEPGNEAAARALFSTADQAERGALLADVAEATSDGDHRALLLTEAALRRGWDDVDTFEQLLGAASEAAPTLPFASRLGELGARVRGDATAVVGWLDRRRAASDDGVERALDGVREALLVAETDLERAANLVDEAVAARPTDVGLRALSERLTPRAGAERGAWREELARASEDPATRRHLAIVAAMEYERAGDASGAARAADLLADEGGGVATIIAERTASAGTAAARLAERLLERAKETSDVAEQRELYERLSRLDAERGDASSALLWQTAILEHTPEHLPALRAIEQQYITLGRDDDLESVASALARSLHGSEASAHAWIAARLRARAHGWEAARELTDLAAAASDAPHWALRAALAYARGGSDDARLLALESRLAELAPTALDGATLSLRAAEAASRLDQLDRADALLARATELVPEHWVALSTRAEVLEARGQHAAAAAVYQAVAEGSGVAVHQLDAWFSAAVLWLDSASDLERGRHCLERAFDLNVRHDGAFNRLRDLYVAAGDRSKLAELLERRLAETTDAGERVSLEVTRGKALADVGDRAAAKAALAAALEVSPDHQDALTAFVELCLAEGDWESAEQSLLRLARGVTEPARQAEIYRQLAGLYDEHLDNPERAEVAYREVQKRLPDDISSLDRLIDVYGRLGNAARALECATALAERAASPEESRDRTVRLALVFESIAGDRRKAEATFDKAKKQWPHDGVLLRAHAEFYARGGESSALGVLLERSANEARRALSTGRFDASFFEVLATVAELRGQADAGVIARATLSALSGTPVDVPGAGLGAADPRLDDLLAPDALFPPLRVLLKKSGDALDAAYPIDLRALRAAPLPTEAAQLAAFVQQLSGAFGLGNVGVFVSPALGPVCMPVSSSPPQLVLGKALFEAQDDAVRFFLIVRALKILQARAATFARTAPIDLWPVCAGWLLAFAPNWQPPGADAKKTAEARQRITPMLSKNVDQDAPVIALEVIGGIGNRATQLATAVNQLGNRAAILALGDPNAALRGVALATGLTGGPPEDPVERGKWIVRNPEARDLMVFSVSEAYAEARRRLGR